MLVSRKRRAALLVDFDNVIAQSGSQVADAIGNWLAWLEDGGFDPKGVRRDFAIRRVYWNVGNDTAHRLKFKKHKFETRLCRAVRNKDKASSADFDITIDAVELRRERPRLQDVFILSYDSDFLTVLNHLQVNDIAVVGMAKGDDRPARAFREMADHVIEHEAFVASFVYKREKRRLLSPPRTSVKRPRPEESAPAPPGPEPPQSSQLASAEPTEKSDATASGPRTAKKGAARRGRRKSAKAGSANARLAEAAEMVAKAAASSPSASLSRKFVCRALEAFEGFTMTGAEPWLGCKNYATMIGKFAAISPAFEIVQNRNGGVNLVYRGPEAAPSP